MFKLALATWHRQDKGHCPFNWRAIVSYRWYQNHMARKGLYF